VSCFFNAGLEAKACLTPRLTRGKFELGDAARIQSRGAAVPHDLWKGSQFLVGMQIL
jgi:hypothetical protein